MGKWGFIEDAGCVVFGRSWWLDGETGFWSLMLFIVGFCVGVDGFFMQGVEDEMVVGQRQQVCT